MIPEEHMGNCILTEYCDGYCVLLVRDEYEESERCERVVKGLSCGH